MQDNTEVNSLWLADIKRKLMRRISLEYLVTDMLNAMPADQAIFFRNRYLGIDTLNRQGYYVPKMNEQINGNGSVKNASPSGLTVKQEAIMGGEEE